MNQLHASRVVVAVVVLAITFAFAQEGCAQEAGRGRDSEIGGKVETSDVGSSEFWNHFLSEMSLYPYNRVVVCLHDDRENVSIANDIEGVEPNRRRDC